MLAFYLSLLETDEDRDKFEYLYKRYSSLLKYVANQRLHDNQLAEDAVHNAFLKIIQSFCEIDDPAGHKTRHFLVIVTERAAIDLLRKNRRVISVDYDEIEPLSVFRPDMLDNLAVEELAKAIASLPEVHRTVLELHAYHGLSDRQIATVLDISYEAVRKRLERARSMLAAKLQK